MIMVIMIIIIIVLIITLISTASPDRIYGHCLPFLSFENSSFFNSFNNFDALKNKLKLI